MRADAQRNRQRLITAARDAFAAGGVETSLEEVARTAGVGIGTLYRHFPTRDVLVAEIYRDAAERLGEAANTLAAERPPLDALAEWLDVFIDYLATKQLLGAVLDSVVSDCSAVRDAAGVQVKSSIGLLVARARAAGVIGGEVDPADLLRALFGVMRSPDLAESADGAPRAKALARLLVAGMARTPDRPGEKTSRADPD